MAKAKTVYGYDAQTGEFTGAYECQPDPMNPGQFLVPANSATAKPPATGENEAVCYDNGKWLKKQDLRGRQQLNADTMQVSKVSAIGDLPEGCHLLTDDQAIEIRHGRLVKVEKNKVVIYDPPKSVGELRASEYPEITEFVDAHVKINSGDPDLKSEGEAQLEKYYLDCMAVKTKYPKGKK